MQAKCQTAYAERRHTRNLILLQQHVLGVRRENIEFREANGRPMTLSNKLLSHEALSRNVGGCAGRRNHTIWQEVRQSDEKEWVIVIRASDDSPLNLLSPRSTHSDSPLSIWIGIS